MASRSLPAAVRRGLTFWRRSIQARVVASTVLATTRAWIDRRQKVRPRRTAAGRLRVAIGVPYAVPALYPTPRTVTTISGFSGSCSTFDRRRCTCTLTSRVSAACR